VSPLILTPVAVMAVPGAWSGWNAVRRWHRSRSSHLQSLIREALAAHLAGVDRTADLQRLRTHQSRRLEESLVELLRTAPGPARRRLVDLAVSLQFTAQWERRYRSRIASRRREAVARLALAGREIGRDTLLTSLADKDDFVKLEAARALIRWGAPSDIEAVFRAATRQSQMVRTIMNEGLRRYGPALAAEALPAVLRFSEPRQRIIALEMFRAWGHTVQLPSLAPLFRHADPAVRAAALYAAPLARLTEEDAAPILHCLEDTDQKIRAAAAQAVSRMRLRGHVAELARCFETSKVEAGRSVLENVALS